MRKNVGAKTKRCPVCGRRKRLDAFGMNKRGRDGRNYRCRKCVNECDRKWRAANPAAVRKLLKEQNARFRAFIGELKAKPCTDCGVQYPPWIMHFDHVRGKKLFNVGNWNSGSRKALLREVAKCDVVCANCHAQRTERRRRQA